jgi:hypothetical protein
MQDRPFHGKFPHWFEPARQTPIIAEADVVVVGGGTAGTLAAVSASRQGRSVLLIERSGALGGMLTLGLNTKPSGILTGGLPQEIWNRARAIGAAGNNFTASLKGGQAKLTSTADSAMLKLLLVNICRSSGVTLLFESLASEPMLEGNKVTGVIVENKGGRWAVKAEIVIDCSADGDVAAKAGAPFSIGTGAPEEAMQPVSMFFMMHNVDLPTLAEWAAAHPDEVPEAHIPDTKVGLSYSLWLRGFGGLLQRFQRRTGMTLQRRHITLKSANGEMYVNATRVAGRSGLSPLEASDAIVECYRQIEICLQFLRADVPGFKNAALSAIAPVLGVRETRHIIGDYVLTGEDVIGGTTFVDSIAADASVFDIHDVGGSDLEFKEFGPYEIPFRCLVPRNVEQLLMAGRCISVDHIAHGRTRNIPACMATGQAAGIAAAVAVQTNSAARAVDVPSIQEILAKLGMPSHIHELP